MEHEIKGHVVKAYKVWKSPGASFWHKLKEIAIEVGIIVFAVLFSIWVHDLSEHSQQQKEVKEFLLGLKADLQSDIVEMRNDKDAYKTTAMGFKYLISQPYGTPFNKDSLNWYKNFLFSSTGLVPNNGRYEGFKSSGKLGNIEALVLQNDITDLYQEDIPLLLSSTDAYTERKKLLMQFYYKNAKQNADGKTNIDEVLASNEAQNICATLDYVGEVESRYDNAIAKSQKIIKQIDDLYGLK